MKKHSVAVFKPYPFTVGQKIRIEGGPRNGDWEVIGVTDKKVRLRCPISLKEFEWDHFCYFSEQFIEITWPKED